MKRFFNFVTQGRRWALLFSLFWIIPCIFALVWVSLFVPTNASLRVDRTGAIQLLILSLSAILPSVIAGICYWRGYYQTRKRLSVSLNQASDLDRSNTKLGEKLSDALDRVSDLERSNAELEEKLKITTEQAGLSIRLYPEGFGDIEYALIERLFRDCQKVWLYPLPGGFSGSLVFQAESENRQGRHQRSMVLKLGDRSKIKTEEQNYNTFVKPYIGHTVELIRTEYKGKRGAILFTYANLRGKTLTFEECYSDAKRNTIDDVVAVIEELFQNTLRLWLAGAQPNPCSYLYQTYSLPTEDWEEICKAVSDLGFDLGANYFNCLGRHFPNPLKETQEWFRDRQGQKFKTMETICHRDANSRNILIDGNRNVFVIDFAKTERDHLLRDFCKLEAEIKFCLTRLHGDDDIERAVALEEELLFTNREPFADLESLLHVNPVVNSNPRLERARSSVAALRHIASQAMGMEVNKPTKQYYLGLLHYTLNSLRYDQCDRNSKLYALISASLLCQALR